MAIWYILCIAIWYILCMVIWYILRPFGNLVAIGYGFPRFGTLCQEKSGNPRLDTDQRANYPAVTTTIARKSAFRWQRLGIVYL
jgi:hypothetical protein